MRLARRREPDDIHRLALHLLSPVARRPRKTPLCVDVRASVSRQPESAAKRPTAQSTRNRTPRRLRAQTRRKMPSHGGFAPRNSRRPSACRGTCTSPRLPNGRASLGSLNVWECSPSRTSGGTGTRAAQLAARRPLLRLSSLAEGLGKTVCCKRGLTIAWTLSVKPGVVIRAAAWPHQGRGPHPPVPSCTSRPRTSGRLETPSRDVHRVRRLAGLPLPRSFDLDAFRS